MEKKRMPDPKSKIKWDKENVDQICIKLMHKTDMDIINALEGKGAKATEVKRLLRIALEVEKAKEAARD